MKFENTNVYNFENALRGMRNPLESWKKSDSKFGITESPENYARGVANFYKAQGGDFIDRLDWLMKNGILQKSTEGDSDYPSKVYYEYAFIGPNDLRLAQKLINAGSVHRKFMRQIFVSVDITAPTYTWVEIDTYKVGTVANSTSKMHKLASKPIDLTMFETDDFNPSVIEKETLDNFIDFLENLRLKYNETQDKKYWKELIRWLPMSWLQKRTFTLNYETLHAICSADQRRYHKLNEWSGIDDDSLPNFISWARTLPYAEDLIFLDKCSEK